MPRSRLLCLAVLILLPALVFAQPPAAPAEPTTIAVVNVSYVAQQSTAGKRIFQPVADREQMWAIRIDSQRRALLEQQRKIQETAPAASPERTQLERAFQRSQVEFKRLEEDARNDMVGLERQVAAELRAMLAPILEALVKERGVTLLFDRESSVILWATSAADLSEEVVKRLDAAQ